eukprot:6378998-Alexandrium_andersonii.AAC.1
MPLLLRVGLHLAHHLGGRHHDRWARRGRHHQLQDDVGHELPSEGHGQTSSRTDSPLHRQRPDS